MGIGIDEVEYVAGLARLGLSEKDKELFSNQLSAILEYVAKLNELDTREVAVTFHVVSHHDMMRDDVPQESFAQETTLANAPDRARGCFRVPRII